MSIKKENLFKKYLVEKSEFPIKMIIAKMSKY